MRSATRPDFWKTFKKLPLHVKQKAVIAYKQWRKNPHTPSLQFKRVGKNSPVYSCRIGRNWRALGVLKGDMMIWFWIGSHEDYNNLIKRL